MARCPMVRPDVVRLPLSDGDFVDVKKRLTIAEYRSMISAQWKDTTAGSPITLNFEQVGINVVLAYVVGWSFVDFEGKPLPFNATTLGSIDVATFTEVKDAVESHVLAQAEALEQEKNVTAGSSNAVATS